MRSIEMIYSSGGWELRQTASSLTCTHPEAKITISYKAENNKFKVNYKSSSIQIQQELDTLEELTRYRNLFIGYVEQKTSLPPEIKERLSNKTPLFLPAETKIADKEEGVTAEPYHITLLFNLDELRASIKVAIEKGNLAHLQAIFQHFHAQNFPKIIQENFWNEITQLLDGPLSCLRFILKECEQHNPPKVKMPPEKREEVLDARSKAPSQSVAPSSLAPRTGFFHSTPVVSSPQMKATSVTHPSVATPPAPTPAPTTTIPDAIKEHMERYGKTPFESLKLAPTMNEEQIVDKFYSEGGTGAELYSALNKILIREKLRKISLTVVVPSLPVSLIEQHVKNYGKDPFASLKIEPTTNYDKIPEALQNASKYGTMNDEKRSAETILRNFALREECFKRYSKPAVPQSSFGNV